jgi:hypothetical protein
MKNGKLLQFSRRERIKLFFGDLRCLAEQDRPFKILPRLRRLLMNGTKYIDQIKAAILKRIDEENGMK